VPGYWIGGTVRGLTTSQSAAAARKMHAAWTAPIGVAEETPNQPTTGEMRPAIRKVAAPSREAAVPACAPCLANASTWTQGNVKPAPRI